MNDYKPFRTTRKLTNLRQGRNDWYSIKALATGPSQVSIYDEIGFFGVTAQDFINELNQVHGDIELHLSTPGGEVFDGIAIYNYLKNRPGTVSVVVDSLAASIGSVIAMAASPGHLQIGKNAQIMIHDGFGMGIGNAADMRQLADLLDKTSDNIASIYADRSGKPAETWRNAMKAETWYLGQEAVDAGLADSLQGAPAVTNDWDLSIFNAAPYQPEPYTRKSDEDVKCPSCGKMNDSDAIYCDQCGAKLAGRTDIGNKLTNASADNSPWDASKAWSNGANSDDPAAFYAGICAGRKAGDKTTQAAWALPYKYHPGDAPNAAGVRAGLARLDQTDGLTNKPEAKATLESAMKKINPGYEASDLSSDDLWADITSDLFALESVMKEG